MEKVRNLNVALYKETMNKEDWELDVFYINSNMSLIWFSLSVKAALHTIEENNVKPWCSQDVVFSNVPFKSIQAKFGAIVSKVLISLFYVSERYEVATQISFSVS